VTQINSVEENFKKLFPYAKVKTIGSPFDVDDLTINVDKLLKYRLEIQSKVVEENYFYYPAYFYESKNHKLLSEVSKNLKKDFGISIVCSNGGGLDGIIGYSDLSFEENILLLMNCSALIFPSEFETFGYPLIEAAILKKPILVLNRDYSTSLISNAYFFENNIQSLIEACLDYAKDFDSNNVKIPVIKISINPSDFLQAISEQLECKYEEN
jgi:glycosyltransferase involved in cell wall biosynthesis